MRVYFRHLRDLNSDFLFELDDFVANCHAKVEDEVVFPEMRAAPTGESRAIETTTKRMGEEHKLLQMLGNNTRWLVAEGNGLDKSKVMLYADTLESHNSSEETLLFPIWSSIKAEREREATPRAMKILRDFGEERYLRVTGFSQRLLSSLERFASRPVSDAARLGSSETSSSQRLGSGT